MNWDQIEQKWAEMTRRVRSDLPVVAKTSGNQPAGPALTGAQNPVLEPAPILTNPVSGA